MSTGRCVSQPNQTISFQARIEVHDWKNLWQDNFMYTAYFGRVSFIFHYQILGKFWICKGSAKSFLILYAFFKNSWPRGKHGWLWIQILLQPFFFIRKIDGFTEIWTHILWTQGQLYLPLDHRRFFSSKKKPVFLSTGWETWQKLSIMS